MDRSNHLTGFNLFNLIPVVVGIIIGLALLMSKWVALGSIVFMSIVFIVLGDVYRGLIFVFIVNTLIPHNLFYRVFSVAVTPSRIAFVLLFFSVVIFLCQNPKSLKLIKTPLNKYIYAYMGIMFLSLIINGYALGFPDTGQHLKTSMAFFVDHILWFFFAVILLRSSGRIDDTVKIIPLILSISAIVGITEFYYNENIFHYLQKYFHLSSEITTYISDYLDPGRMRGTVYRSNATFDHSLDFAAAMVLALPLSMHCYFVSNGVLKRILFLLCSILLSFGLILTLSRGAYVAMVIALAIYIGVSKNIRALFMILAVGLLSTVLFFSVRGISSSFFDVVLLKGGLTSEGSIQSRIQDYVPLMDIVKENTLLGIGPGMLQSGRYLSQHPELPDTFESLDNHYLVILGETGVLGLAVFLALLLKIYRGVNSETRGLLQEKQSLRAAILASCIAYFFLTAVFETLAFEGSAKIFWIIVALGMLFKEGKGNYAYPLENKPALI